jgi:hypothetical protein
MASAVDSAGEIVSPYDSIPYGLATLVVIIAILRDLRR